MTQSERDKKWRREIWISIRYMAYAVGTSTLLAGFAYLARNTPPPIMDPIIVASLLVPLTFMVVAFLHIGRAIKQQYLSFRKKYLKSRNS